MNKKYPFIASPCAENNWVQDGVQGLLQKLFRPIFYVITHRPNRKLVDVVVVVNCLRRAVIQIFIVLNPKKKANP